MARPVSEKYKVENIIPIIEKYIEEKELPIFKEVCYLNNWDSSHIYELARDNEELDHTIKKLIDKKEKELEQGGLTGKYKTAMAIFSLKQLGWKDKIELEQSSGEDKNIKIEMVSPSEQDAERVKKIREKLFKSEN